MNTWGLCVAERRNLLAAATATWTLTRTHPGAATDPASLASLSPATIVRIPAAVPGTAASAWRDAFGAEEVALLDVDEWDWWYECQFPADRKSRVVSQSFVSQGIATYAEVWVNGEWIGSNTNAFLGFHVPVPGLEKVNTLTIKCAALSQIETPRRPRSRWRSSLVPNDSIRWHRTPLLGHIKWAGTAKSAGPWAPLAIHADIALNVAEVHAELEAGLGTISVKCRLAGDTRVPVEVTVLLDDAEVAKATALVTHDDVVIVPIREPRRWWPATHGEPNCYTVVVTSDGVTIFRYRVGFRTVEARTTDGRFELIVNDIPIFVRGMVWAPLDPLALGAPVAEYAHAIDAAVDAGANMLRVSGTASFEQDAFYDECSRAGILVWQDCMLATLDPPDENAWLASFADELTFQLNLHAHQPCLAVISGGNEVEQQPVLFGKEPGTFDMTVLKETIPAIALKCAPGTVHVTSSPSSSQPDSGISPLQIRDGISHYFGVGAYTRPLTDARTSGVRFAAESLAFANPPEPSAVTAMIGQPALSTLASVSDAWSAGIARDPGASWNFAETVWHYVRELFPLEAGAAGAPGPHEVRQLDLRRAAIFHTIFTTLVEWRRPESSCAGALILSARDLAPGSGFGLSDSTGRPKSGWFAFRNACAATVVALHDEGLDGIDVHLFHDRAESFDGTLQLDVHGHRGHCVATAIVPVNLGAGESTHLSAEAVLSGFRDFGHAWRFGAWSYDTMTAVLRDAAGNEVYRHTLLLGGLERERVQTGIQASFKMAPTPSIWPATSVQVRTESVATFVALDVPGWTPEDNYFTLPAGTSRTIALKGTDGRSGPLRGTVRALNDLSRHHIIATPPLTGS